MIGRYAIEVAFLDYNKITLEDFVMEEKTVNLENLHLSQVAAPLDFLLQPVYKVNTQFIVDEWDNVQ